MKFIRKLIGRIISKLYWKIGREYDDNEFWRLVVLWNVGKLEADPSLQTTIGKIVVAKLNSTLEKFEHMGTYIPVCDCNGKIKVQTVEVGDAK